MKKALSRLKLSEAEGRQAIRKLKSTHLPKGWHVARPLKGKASSIKELRKLHLRDGEGRIRKAEQVIGKLSRKLTAHKKSNVDAEQIRKTRSKLHHKKRRLVALKTRHEARKADHKAGKVRLCFGSKKLFRAQFDLAANGYASHEDWKADWRAARARQFYVLGSKDETAGCQGCQLVLDEHNPAQGQVTLRLPNQLIEAGAPRQLSLPVRLPWSNQAIKTALNAKQAISYCFARYKKVWRLFVTTETRPVPVRSQPAIARQLQQRALDSTKQLRISAEPVRLLICNIEACLIGALQTSATAGSSSTG